MKRLAMLTVAVALLLLTAVPAYAAQTSAGDTYLGQGAGAVGGVSKGDGVDGGSSSSPAAPQQVRAAASDTSGQLPFTGLDVALLVLGGTALIGVGVGLRRFARPLS